jgi:hypothetical protein
MSGTLLDEEGRSGQAGGRNGHGLSASKDVVPLSREWLDVRRLAVPRRKHEPMTREWSALPSANSLWVATVAGTSTLELGHKLRFATTDTVIH